MAALTTPFVALGILSVLAALAIAGLAWRQRDTSGAIAYVALMLVLAAWSALYVGQLLHSTVPAKRPWFVARHTISPPIAVLFWVFAARYTDREDLLAARYMTPLFATCLGLAALVAVNPAGIHVTSLTIDDSGPVALLDVAFGPLFWALIVYIIGVVGAGHAFIVALFTDAFAVYRRQLATMSVVGAIEFVLLGMFLSQHVSFVPAVNPWPNVQLITYGATIVALPLGWSYFNDALFDIQPLAHRTVIENMTDPVLIFDANGAFRYANEPATRLLDGGGATALDGSSARDVLADRPGLMRRYRDARGDGGSTTGTDGDLELDVGSETRYFDVDVSEIRNSTGTGIGTVVVARDVTEKRRRSRKLRERTAELEAKTAQLERQNEQLNRFAGVVSHDLRNPLGVARGRLALAREECDSEHLDGVDRAHERMEALIEDLLTLARAGERVTDFESVTLASLTRSCWRSVGTAEGTVTTETDRTVRADPGRLRQLLENLLRNAVEHGGADVTVTIGDLEDGTGFYVADDGPGIPKAERDRVFEGGYSTAETGTGFGLSIVKGIAEAHGWEIRIADSEAGGTRFEITGVEFA